MLPKIIYFEVKSPWFAVWTAPSKCAGRRSFSRRSQIPERGAGLYSLEERGYAGIVQMR